MESNSYLDDKVTTRRVETVLHQNKSYDFPNVKAEVSNGVVYLTGTVETAAQREKAEQLARQIHRVDKLENEISVRQ